MNQSHFYFSAVERPSHVKQSYNLKESEVEIVEESDWLPFFKEWKLLPKENPKRKELGDHILAAFYTSIYKYVAHVLQFQGKTKSPYFDDAFQEACLKFMEMLESFEMSRNMNPFLFAKKRIQQTVLTSVNMFMLDTHKKDVMNSAKVQIAMQKFPHLEVEELALKLNMTESKIRYYIDLLKQKNTSLDVVEVSDAFGVDTRTNVHNHVIYEINHENLIQELNRTLSDEELKILTEMVGFDCNKKTSGEICEEHGCTQQELYNRYYKIRTKLQRNKRLLDLLK